jgi:hypothetical protein
VSTAYNAYFEEIEALLALQRSSDLSRMRLVDRSGNEVVARSDVAELLAMPAKVVLSSHSRPACASIERGSGISGGLIAVGDDHKGVAYLGSHELAAMRPVVTHNRRISGAKFARLDRVVDELAAEVARRLSRHVARKPPSLLRRPLISDQRRKRLPSTPDDVAFAAIPGLGDRQLCILTRCGCHPILDAPSILRRVSICVARCIAWTDHDLGDQLSIGPPELAPSNRHPTDSRHGCNGAARATSLRAIARTSSDERRQQDCARSLAQAPSSTTPTSIDKKPLKHSAYGERTA